MAVLGKGRRKLIVIGPGDGYFPFRQTTPTLAHARRIVHRERMPSKPRQGPTLALHPIIGGRLGHCLQAGRAESKGCLLCCSEPLQVPMRSAA